MLRIQNNAQIIKNTEESPSWVAAVLPNTQQRVAWRNVHNLIGVLAFCTRLLTARMNQTCRAFVDWAVRHRQTGNRPCSWSSISMKTHVPVEIRRQTARRFDDDRFIGLPRKQGRCVDIGLGRHVSQHAGPEPSQWRHYRIRCSGDICRRRAINEGEFTLLTGW